MDVGVISGTGHRTKTLGPIGGYLAQRHTPRAEFLLSPFKPRLPDLITAGGVLGFTFGNQGGYAGRVFGCVKFIQSGLVLFELIAVFCAAAVVNQVGRCQLNSAGQ